MRCNVQACANQILGNTDVVFPPQLKDICNGKFHYLYSRKRQATGEVMAGRKHKWKPANGYEQWWVDALTVDPSHMLGGTGLWEHGRPQPASCTPLENASVGSLPAIMVYLVAHPEFGTHAFFPYHGAKHGSVCDKATGAKALYQGFDYWYTGVPEAVLKLIVKLGYCNKPSGIAKFEDINKNNPEEIRLFREGPFNPRFFMV